MKIKVTRPFSGPYGAPIAGDVIDVPDEYAESIIADGRAEPEKPAPKKSAPKRKRTTKKKKTETATTKDDVETADESD